MFTTLLDPYRGRDLLIGPGQIIDRAALAECRDTVSRPPCKGARWQLGWWHPCADHLQDAIQAGAALARDGRA
jgi:hypothetical protein